MSREIRHPPNPASATSRELSLIQRLHRASHADTDNTPDARELLGEALAAIVKLIEGRGKWSHFDEEWARDRHDD